MMKLIKAEVNKYKSIKQAIIDLSHTDNIASIVGQNESGKSSILEALRDFYIGKFSADSVPFSDDSTGDEPEQSVSCTFEVEKKDASGDFENKILKFLHEGIIDKTIKFKSNIFKTGQVFTVTFDGENYRFDEKFINVIDNSFELETENLARDEASEQNVDEEGNELNTQEAEIQEETVDISVIHPDIEQYIIKNVIPEFIYFEGGTCDVLPDFIAVSDLVDKKGDGWTAVDWLEKCVQLLNNDKNFNFKSLGNMGSIPRGNKVNQSVEEITADFRSDFRQRIHGVDDSLKVVFNLGKDKKEGDEDYRDYIDFAVETKRGEPLPVRMRSKGMIWFLSFWLALKSLKEKKAIILVDEPDKNLHINAQKDLMSVFEKIAKKFDHQIVYATHAPTLVPIDNIYRVYLIINDDQKGTISENILKTQIGNSKNKQEAISLVNYAIGCDVSNQNMVFKKQNVILEGLSDFMYFQAMAKVLSKNIDYAFIPGVGTKGSKLNPLVGICIGYNLNWCVILDGDQAGDTKFEDLRDSIFAGEDEAAKKQIRQLQDGSIVEDLFTVDDIELVARGDKSFTLGRKPKLKDNLSYIGKKRKNIFARLFLEKVTSKKLAKKDLSSSLINSFEQVFNFIEESLKNQP